MELGRISKSSPRKGIFGFSLCDTLVPPGECLEGVSTQQSVERPAGLLPGADYVVAYGYDHGWTTNLPAAIFWPTTHSSRSLMMAAPISLEHGGPARGA